MNWIQGTERTVSAARLLPLFGLILSVLVLSGCRAGSGAASAKESAAPTLRSGDAKTAAAAASPRKPGVFADVTEKAGIRFTLDNGERGDYRLPATTPAGCAFLDYDGDGFQDIFLVQAGALPGALGETKRPPCQLYKNRGDGTFEDITAEAGIDRLDQGYAQAVAAADYDNDGDPDLFITAYGGNHLLRNRGGRGGFENVTAQSGVADKGKRWPASAAWGDYDKDGLLDLFVTYYAPWTPEKDVPCKNAKGQRTYCSPELYESETMRLYRNAGGGRFVDVTNAVGIAGVKGRGLAVVWMDYDQDSWLDIYIACDLTPNLLLRNQKGKRFAEVGLEAGVAYGTDAGIYSGMGIGVGDYENRGVQNIAITNFSAQPNTVYRYVEGGVFEDASYQSGIGTASLNFLAWGLEFFDYDNDGWLDLIVGCGHIDPFIADTAPNTTYKQRKQLMKNLRNGQFRDAEDDLGDMAEERVTRGLAIGDFDNDGRVDVLDNAQNQPARLFRNVSPAGGRFITLRLEGVKSNRDAAGAMVWVTPAGGKRRVAEIRCGSSYASTSDRRLHFGLGEAERIEKLEVRWPNGLRQTFADLPADTFYYLREGAPAPVPDPLVKKTH